MRVLQALLVFAAVFQSETGSDISPEYYNNMIKKAYACENSSIMISCKNGEVIRIDRANYGRFNLQICSQRGKTEGGSLQCMAPRSRTIVAERCDGHNNCTFNASNDVFSDPCPDTYKYVEVHYLCEAVSPEYYNNMVKKVYACENSSIMISCKNGEVIRIDRANYGRLNLQICSQRGKTEGWMLPCMASRSRTIVAERCDGHNNCTFNASNDVFSDPCPDTYKYVEVHYLCEADVDECKNGDSVCNKSGYCINTQGSFICICKEGFTGRNCETEIWPRPLFAGVVAAVTIAVTVIITLLIIWKRGGFRCCCNGLGQRPRKEEITCPQPDLRMGSTSDNAIQSGDAYEEINEEPDNNMTEMSEYLELTATCIKTRNGEYYNCRNEYEKLDPHRNYGNDMYSPVESTS